MNGFICVVRDETDELFSSVPLSHRLEVLGKCEINGGKTV